MTAASAYIIAIILSVAALYLYMGIVLLACSLLEEGRILEGVLNIILFVALSFPLLLVRNKKIKASRRGSQDIYINDRSKYNYESDEILTYEQMIRIFSVSDEPVEYIKSELLRKRCVMTRRETEECIKHLYKTYANEDNIYDVIEIEALLNKNLEYNNANKYEKAIIEIKDML